MAITKTGKVFSRLGRDAPEPLLRQTTRWGITHPLAAGVTALGVASGDQSVGESVGMGLGGSAGFFATDRALKNRAQRRSSIPGASPGASQWGQRLARAGRFMPGWMRPVGNFVASMAGGVAASELGRHAGSKVPIWKRNQAPQSPY